MNHEAQHDNPELAPNAKWVHETSAEVRIKLILGHKESVNSCELIRNEEVIFTVSNDNTVKLWDFHTGKELHTYENLHANNTIPRAKVSHDNTKFITCGWDRHLKCWDLETGKLLWSNTHDYFLTSCGFSYGDSSQVVSVSDVDHLVKIWETRNGKLIRTIPDLHNTTITTCQFSPKNDRIVTTSMDRTCKFYDIIANKPIIALNHHKGVISNCSFTHDERKFATCSWDKSLLIWDIATGMYRKNGPVVLAEGHEGSVSSCFINDDGLTCVSVGYDGRLVLWNISYGIPKLILRGHTNWINDVVLTKDNKWAITVGKDKEIRQWDIENCDSIKLVAEQNKTLGDKLTNCSNCQRPFGTSKLERHDDLKLYCVFCRLQLRTAKENSETNGFLNIGNNNNFDHDVKSIKSNMLELE